MRAVRIHEHGGPGVLTLDEIQDPTPQPGQVLVNTVRTGVNFIETYQREGVYDVELPFLLGSEGSGVVEAVGEGVTQLSVGQRVMTSQGSGTYAQKFLVNAEQAVAVPDHISDDDAGALPLQGFTAHYLTRSTYPVGPETTAVITAAAGGVGGLAIQYMKQLGATVIGLTSSQDKADTARSLGADHVLPYDGFADAVMDLTQGQGADVVYDSVGRTTFDESLAATTTRGTVVLFGGASGQVPPFDLQRLNAMGSLYVTRPSLNAYLRSPEELQWRANDLFQAIQNGLTVRVGGSYPLEDAASAHTDLESRGTQGKLLLTP
ncbi:quinone oxidoreductase family protein [Kocuria sp.]|uniref:quinone oxidoreductase family protein n=1 Tax=Kocuria sp. TaxID=1871328 RepID=UPI0026DF7462|nr:quinone oxidoreductase [Kocuria sp.]MDO5618708.1 quinone oxidoreductase [Kocuria sp.]